MIDASNRVLTNIKTYVAETCKNVSNYSSKAPPEFPAVSVVQIDNPDACMDLENNENAVIHHLILISWKVVKKLMS